MYILQFFFCVAYFLRGFDLLYMSRCFKIFKIDVHSFKFSILCIFRYFILILNYVSQQNKIIVYVIFRFCILGFNNSKI